MTNPHEPFITECYRLAESAVREGNHPFGALLMVDGGVILTAENTVVSTRDCTRHAELNLISRAVRELDLDTVRRSVLYTSTEPCVMCSGAIYWAQLPTVVYGCSAASLQAVTGEPFLIPCREILARGRRAIQVIGPVLEGEGLRIHRGFWT
jgi:tRNA(Arg) A34 adenosine deaminase TadA